jgi:beta-glucosidase
VGSKEHLQLAEKAAEKSLVLLKNDGILPLKNGKKIALIGPNADNFDILIANYNGEPVVPVTPLTGIRAKIGRQNVLYSAGCPIVPGIYTNYKPVPYKNLFHDENGKLKNGLKAEYFSEEELKGQPAFVRIDSSVNFYWMRSPLDNQLEDSFSVRWTGILIPDQSGTFSFGGNTHAKINGKDPGKNLVELVKGQKYDLEVTFTVVPFWWNNAVEPSAKFEWVETSKDYKKEALDAAKKADVIVFCGGISSSLEGEEMPLSIDGFSHGDRTHINLPAVQEDLLKELKKTGKPIIYVNFSGSAVAMNWENENVPAIIQAFYPGEATGTALARMLFGDFNPAGRLPVTFYKSVNDLPDFKDYRMEGRTYRYFKGEPLWGFGYGLSYTTFTYKNLVVPESSPAGSDVKISVDVTNSGKRDGEEVVEIYVTNQGATVPVPLKAMAGFKRVMLKAGETKKIELVLKAESFSVINDEYNRVAEAGKFIVYAGGRQPVQGGADKNTLSDEINITGSTVVIP